MDRDKDRETPTAAGGSGRTRHGASDGRSTAKWGSIIALGAGALWNTWNVAVLATRGESPEIPFVAAVLMTTVAAVAWRRWPG
jgi:hypothetical protein